MPTPDDVERLIAAGYESRLQISLQIPPQPLDQGSMGIVLVLPYGESGNGNPVFKKCTFFDSNTGHCELHESGLKPTEGQCSSSHYPNLKLWMMVADSWATAKGTEVLQKFGLSDWLYAGLAHKYNILNPLHKSWVIPKTKATPK